MTAISHAGTAVGILTQEGIVLAAEKKVTSKLLERGISSEKMYRIGKYTHHAYICACMAVHQAQLPRI